jgi:TPR repeat protein
MNDLAALLYIEDNNAEEAEQMLRAAMAAGQPDALRNLGRLLINTGSVDEGESMLRRATKRGDGQAAHWLGIHLKQKGRGRAAEQWLSRADELGHLDLHRSRMTVFLAEGTASADPAPGTVDE